MTDMATELRNQYDAKNVQDGFLHMIKSNCPYKTPTGVWADEDQVIAALDFTVMLVDFLRKRMVEVRDVDNMFPTIGHALEAFEKSDYFKSQEQGRRIKGDHILLIDCWREYIH